MVNDLANGLTAKPRFRIYFLPKPRINQCSRISQLNLLKSDTLIVPHLMNSLSKYFLSLSVCLALCYNSQAQLRQMPALESGLISLVDKPATLTQPLNSSSSKDDKPKGKVRKTTIFDINKPNKNFNLKINLIDAALGNLMLSPELKINRKNTMSLNIMFGSRRKNESRYEFFSFSPEYRHYIFKDQRGDFHGGYVGLYGSYKNEQSEAGSRYNLGGLGAVVGRQWIIKDIITIDTYIGAGYYMFNAHLQKAGSTDQAPGNGDIRFGIAIGIAPE